MSNRFTRSWDLVKASGSVLQQDRQLLMFPLISSISVVLVVLCFALPMFGLSALDGLSNREYKGSVYLLAFLFYVAQYTVIFFFNAALVGAAMIRLDGGSPTLGDGLRIASSKFGAILGYAVIAATVGMILRAIQERVGFIGKLIVGFLGAGWALATYLVVPTLVATDVGPLQAVKDSTSLLKRTWGESIIVQGGLGFAFFLIYVLVIVSGVALMIGASAITHGPALTIIVGVLLVLALMFTALVHSTLSGIYAAALYRYATRGESTTGFDPTLLASAFAPGKA
ncbi:MAG: DUF6159 family protein [Pseudomonadota bacterium]